MTRSTCHGQEARPETVLHPQHTAWIFEADEHGCDDAEVGWGRGAEEGCQGNVAEESLER